MSGYRQGARNMPAGLSGTGFANPIPGNAMNANPMTSGAMSSRMINDVNRLTEFNVVSPPTALAPQQQQTPNANPQDMNYDEIDLDEILRRQLNADINAYSHDLEYCNNCLTIPDLSPQENRTLTLRTLDIRHRLRAVSHRPSRMANRHQLEIMEYHQRTGGSSMANATPRYGNGQYPTSTPRSSGAKRQRTSKKLDGSDADSMNVSMSALADADDVTPSDAQPFTDNSQLQRLGYWKCNLCTSRKFLNAGTNRVPSAPCKWALRDISKMLNHFLDLHTEHAPSERCVELGNALQSNRGPFEYWLTRTRSQEIDDLAIIDEYIATLQSGNLPQALRNLNRAAQAFPNTVAGLAKK